MKNQKGISLIVLIIIIVIVVAGIIIIATNNQSNDRVYIEWGSKPSDEYFELLKVAFDYNLLGNKEATLSQETFNTLGKDVKNAKGKWFKKSNVDFWSQVFYDDNEEMVTLTDGKHVAIFIPIDGSGTVSYNFFNEEQLIGMKYSMTDFKGYKITIK